MFFASNMTEFGLDPEVVCILLENSNIKQFSKPYLGLTGLIEYFQLLWAVQHTLEYVYYF